MLFGNGSDEIINLLSVVASGGKGGSVLFPEPTFTVYRLSAESHGLDVIGVPSSSDDFSCDIENMLNVIREKQPSLIFLASPNNPTGNSVDQESIIRLCDAADGLVILDEAYCKFAAVSHVKLLSSIDNLLIMQTFSKIGFAGIRLGVLFGANDWIELLDRVRMPYNVNSLTQATAAFAIDHWEHFQLIIDEIVAERERMMQFMIGLQSILVWPSDGNFILFRPHSMASEHVHKELQNRDILIKNMSGTHPALLNCLRVTIGTKEENILFRDRLIEVIGR
jgi:histidinol-phosphate aminotransferase